LQREKKNKYKSLTTTKERKRAQMNKRRG